MVTLETARQTLEKNGWKLYWGYWYRVFNAKEFATPNDRPYQVEIALDKELPEKFTAIVLAYGGRRASFKHVEEAGDAAEVFIDALVEGRRP